MSNRRARREPPEHPQGLPQDHRDRRPSPPGSLYGVSREAIDRYMEEQGMDLSDQALRSTVACEIRGNRIDYRLNPMVGPSPADRQRLIGRDPEMMNRTLRVMNGELNLRDDDDDEPLAGAQGYNNDVTVVGEGLPPRRRALGAFGSSERPIDVEGLRPAPNPLNPGARQPRRHVPDAEGQAVHNSLVEQVQSAVSQRMIQTRNINPQDRAAFEGRIREGASRIARDIQEWKRRN